MNTNNTWFQINNISEVDTPALIIYPERVKENIRIVKTFIENTDNLRPHVKTHKSPEVTQMLIAEGIHKFKCATIAEAEMLAQAKAKDVLLAYQPIGPKAERLSELIKKYPATKFSCLIDNIESAKHIASVAHAQGLTINVYIDLNVGMNRTGIPPQQALQLYKESQTLTGINIIGLHAYDGHLRDADLEVRTQRCNEAYLPIEKLQHEIQTQFHKQLTIIAGGTPTFPIHAKRTNVECSPGTFIFWDKGYQSILTEQPFLFAALVVTRIISKPNNETICIDLGHKSIASENALTNRIHFLNAEGLQPTGHSEEHMVLKTENNNTLKVGDVLYGIPYHICPTVALYDEAQTITANNTAQPWHITARKKKLTI